MRDRRRFRGSPRALVAPTVRSEMSARLRLSPRPQIPHLRPVSSPTTRYGFFPLRSVLAASVSRRSDVRGLRRSFPALLSCSRLGLWPRTLDLLIATRLSGTHGKEDVHPSLHGGSEAGSVRHQGSCSCCGRRGDLRGIPSSRAKRAALSPPRWKDRRSVNAAPAPRGPQVGESLDPDPAW